jgi:hypothetical protein
VINSLKDSGSNNIFQHLLQCMIKGVILPPIDDVLIRATLINKKKDTNDVKLEDQPFDLLLSLPTFSNCSIVYILKDQGW